MNIFNSIYANAWHELPITWIEKSDELENGGLDYDDFTTIGDIVGRFMQLPIKQVRGEKGYYNTKRAELVVPSREINNYGIVPSTYTSFVEYNNERYRITDIIDLSHVLHTHCFHFKLERVELLDN